MAESITKPIFLYSTVFLVGAAVLIIEIVGTRTLAPMYGSTIYVWSSLITVTLAALAFGYWGGGKTIDVWPSERLLYSSITLAGISLLILFSAASFILLYTNNLGLRFGPLVATAALFFAPLFLLGSISPMAVRLKAKTISHIGGTTGSLYAVATTGSLFGGLFSGFWLAPNYPSGTIIVLLSIAIILLGLVGIALYSDVGAWTKVKMMPFGIIVALTLFAYYGYHTLTRSFLSDTASPMSDTGIAAGIVTDAIGKPIHKTLRTSQGSREARVVYHEPSLYGDVIVFDFYDNLRCLAIDGANESCWNYTGNEGSGIASTYANNIATLLTQFTTELNRNIKDVLIIGVGGGTLLKGLDGTPFRIDAVEINPDLPAIARDYFGLPTNLEYTIYTDDGRHFLNATTKKYDAIVLDICEFNQTSAHLRTKEFWELAKSHLNDPQTGIIIASHNVVINNPASEELEERIARSMKESFLNIHSVRYFDEDVEAFDVSIFIASNSASVPTQVNGRSIEEWQFSAAYEALSDERLDEAIKLGIPAAQAIREQAQNNFGRELFLP